MTEGLGKCTCGGKLQFAERKLTFDKNPDEAAQRRHGKDSKLEYTVVKKVLYCPDCGKETEIFFD